MYSTEAGEPHEPALAADAARRPGTARSCYDYETAREPAVGAAPGFVLSGKLGTTP